MKKIPLSLLFNLLFQSSPHLYKKHVLRNYSSLKNCGNMNSPLISKNNFSSKDICASGAIHPEQPTVVGKIAGERQTGVQLYPGSAGCIPSLGCNLGHAKIDKSSAKKSLENQSVRRTSIVQEKNYIKMINRTQIIATNFVIEQLIIIHH